MKKTFWLVGSLVLLLAAALGGGYWLLRDQVQPLHPEAALPADALFLLDLPEGKLWPDTAEANSVFGVLAGTGLVARLEWGLTQLSSSAVIGRNSVEPAPANTDTSTAAPAEPQLPEEPAAQVLAGAYLSGAASVELLLVRRTAGKPPRDRQPAEQYEGMALYTSAEEGQTWWEFWHRGLRVGSSSRVLIEDAIRSCKGAGRSESRPDLERLRELASKGKEPTLYLNLAELSAYLGQFVQPRFAPWLQGLREFSTWLAFSLQPRSHSLSFSGYAAPLPEEQLARFSRPDSTRIRVEQVLPRQTALFWRCGGDAQALFRPDFLQATAELGDAFVQAQAGEWACALVERPGEGALSAALFALGVHQPDTLSGFLETLSEQDGSAAGLEIRRWREGAGSPISLRFGRSLSAFDQGWYALVDAYLLCSPDREVLAQALEAYALGQTLAQEPLYREQKARLLPSANTYLYASLPALLPALEGLVSDRQRDAVLQGAAALSNLQPFALQLDRYRDLFLLSGFVDYGERQRGSDATLWSLALDTGLACPPRLVRDHRDGKPELLLQDQAHRLYLVDRGGRVLWKRDLGAALLGDVHQVDYYKNGKLQYLFCTTDKVHLIDRNGRDVADFPISLTAGAGNGLAVFDYEGKRDYRFFVGAAGENVYGYYQTGKPLPGWSPLRQAGPLAFPVQHNAHADRDYLLLVSKRGRVALVDRRGENRIKPLELGAPLLAPMHWSAGPEPGWLSCDTLGNLIRLSPSGQLSRVPLPGLDARSLVAVVEPAGSGSGPLLSLAGRGQLSLRDVSGLERWSARLPDEGPQAWAATAPGCPWVGIWSAQSSEWNLFNTADGAPVPGFPMYGSGPFAILPLTAAGEWVLLGERDGRLIAQVIGQ
jgi:hypothetical protein